MPRRSLFKEPDVVLSMKCSSCEETLLFGRTLCHYCGQRVEPNYAVQATALSFIINRAIAFGNTVETVSPAMLVFIPSAIFCYLLDWRLLFGLCVLLPSILGSIPVIRWGYKYGDLPVADPEFRETRKKMRLHLNCWLAYIAIHTLVLIIW